ncbi:MULTISPECIES: hypothetical protein [Flavobacterium]|nr:hypothetical protein [Flavobacterium gawalongense]
MITIENFVAHFSTVLNYKNSSETTINEQMGKPFVGIVKRNSNTYG